jgi:hypothetical protein
LRPLPRTAEHVRADDRAHYAALFGGAGADIADRLDALDVERDRATSERAEDANEV